MLQAAQGYVSLGLPGELLILVSMGILVRARNAVSGVPYSMDPSCVKLRLLDTAGPSRASASGRLDLHNLVGVVTARLSDGCGGRDRHYEHAFGDAADRQLAGAG